MRRVELSLHGYVRKGSERISCIVKNASSRGALLTFLQPTTLPECFTLYIAEPNLRVRCVTRHASEQAVGVEFSSNRQEAEQYFASPFGTTRRRRRRARRKDDGGETSAVVRSAVASEP